MKRIICMLLSLVLAFTAVVFTNSLPEKKVTAATTDELQAEIDRLDDEIEANEAKLEALKKDQAKQKEYLEALEKQMKTVEEKATNIQIQIQTLDEEIGDLDDEINQLNREIEMTVQEIVETEANIAASSDALAQRLRNSYLYGEETTLEIFMGSEDLASFMTGVELMKRTTANDKAMIENFKTQVEELNKSKQELEDKRAEVNAKRSDQQIKRDELSAKEQEYYETLDKLEGQYAEIEDYLATLDKDSAVYEQYIKELEQEKAEADAEIDRIYSEYYATSLQASNANPTPGSNGSSGGSGAGKGDPYASNAEWAWPLGNEYCYISSKYGYRDASIGGNAFHGGLDIAGGSGRLHGKPVYATRSGKVITAITSDRGYGIYVIIDHGDGYSSLYAHMSARYVSTGDTVNKGDMIGRVGNTGNSTGAHLHLEIRYYGEKLDPLRFVSKP